MEVTVANIPIRMLDLSFRHVFATTVASTHDSYMIRSRGDLKPLVVGSDAVHATKSEAITI